MTSKAPSGNYFEDFRLGQVIVHRGTRTLTEADAALYLALTGDAHPIQTGATVAALFDYPQPPLNELLVFHIGFGQTVPDISLNAVANLGYADVRFEQPVFPGDTLQSRTEVIGLKENKSGQNGNVYVRSVTRNQRDEVVLSYIRWVMVRKRNRSAPAPKTVVPELPDTVPWDALRAPAGAGLAAYRSHPSAGPHWFEDYSEGERIVHGRGMTVEAGVHTTVTRLYENTARVHFDAYALATDKKDARLVYGGHVISVARGLARDGLENAIAMVAWNGGTHANPVHAGDTIYALTDVLETHRLAPELGALRLRLVALINRNPSGEPIDIDDFDEVKGRRVYHRQVALDFDYTVLMPTREGSA